jgi:hypothetical protein
VLSAGTYLTIRDCQPSIPDSNKFLFMPIMVCSTSDSVATSVIILSREPLDKHKNNCKVMIALRSAATKIATRRRHGGMAMLKMMVPKNLKYEFLFFPDYFLLISVCVNLLLQCLPETTCFQLHLLSHTSVNYCRRQSRPEPSKVRHSFFFHERFSDIKWNLMKQENLDLEKKIKELDLKIIEQNCQIQKLSESDRHYYQTINLNYIKRSESLKEKMETSTTLFLSRELPLSHFFTPSTCRCQRAIRRWYHSSS